MTTKEQAASHACDVLIIGGGVAGCCAAIQAGRVGCDTILLERDAVLGGNAGPNVGVGITGADRYNPFGSETGLIHEIHEEAAWQDAFTHVSPGTTPYNISRRFEAVMQTLLEEAHVRVLKRHHARLPIMRGNRIEAVVAEDLAAYQPIRIDVRHVVIEASGDGEVGALAGAAYDMGSEAQEEYGERSAPVDRSPLVQGTSLVALAHRTHRPVVFSPPPGTAPFVPRVWQNSVASYVEHMHDHWFDGDVALRFLYVTESGGHLDTILDDGAIYETLLKQLWAEWDHIKNGPHREAALYWDLLWVSPKAGKRESRRFLGDYVLTQTDLESGRRFEDDIAYGGHDLDDHRPLGESANIVGLSVPPMYGIPYRCCYSRNIENLLLAGRLISTTHLAHSSARVMRTGGAIGQGVGIAAALCCQYGETPRGLYAHQPQALPNALIRADATLLARPAPTDGDLAQLARVKASSELRYNDQHPGQWIPLLTDVGNVLWDWPPRLERVRVYLRNCTDQPQSVTLAVHRARREPAFVSYAAYHEFGWNDLRDSSLDLVSRRETTIAAHHEGWHDVTFGDGTPMGTKDPTSDADRRIISIARNPQIEWALLQDHGAYEEIAGLAEHDDALRRWKRVSTVGSMRLDPPPALGEGTSAINGFHRRFSHGPTNMWISDPKDGLPQSLELSWDSPVSCRRLTLTFDNLTATREQQPWELGTRVVPHLVREYAVDVCVGGKWHEAMHVQDNYHRFRSHLLNNRGEPVTVESIRLRVLATHGQVQSARVYQVAVYGDKTP